MFRRIGNLIRGFLGLFITGLEKANPDALLDVEKENLRKQIAQYNDGLSHHAGLCEKLMSQIRRLETEERELRARTAAHLNAGNRDAAAQHALRLQTVQRELEENRSQLTQAETTYRDLVKARDVSVQAAQAKINALKNDISDMKMKRATAELSEMASGMISKIGGAGDTLDRLSKMVGEERQKAAGRARVFRARGIPPGDGDRTDIAIEDFGLAENLMIAVAILESGGTLVGRAVPAGREMEDLAGFEACLAEARALIPSDN